MNTQWTSHNLHSHFVNYNENVEKRSVVNDMIV